MDSNFIENQEMTAKHREEVLNKEIDNVATNYIIVKKQKAQKKQVPKTNRTIAIKTLAKTALVGLVAAITISGSVKYAQALHQSDENMINGSIAFTDKVMEIKRENLASGITLTNDQIMEQAVRELEAEKEASNGGRSNG